MTVNYENSATMPISSLQMAANSDDHWFICVCIPGSFVRVLQCVSLRIHRTLYIMTAEGKVGAPTCYYTCNVLMSCCTQMLCSILHHVFSVPSFSPFCMNPYIHLEVLASCRASEVKCKATTKPSTKILILNSKAKT
jgi:hypothetical protein